MRRTRSACCARAVRRSREPNVVRSAAKHVPRRNLAADATLSGLSKPREGLIMTSRRRSATARSVPAQTPGQLLELTQKHIRPLIPLIDRLNEAGAEDELKVISRQLTRLSFRAQPLPSGK